MFWKLGGGGRAIVQWVGSLPCTLPDPNLILSAWECPSSTRSDLWCRARSMHWAPFYMAPYQKQIVWGSTHLAKWRKTSALGKGECLHTIHLGLPAWHPEDVPFMVPGKRICLCIELRVICFSLTFLQKRSQTWIFRWQKILSLNLTIQQSMNYMITSIIFICLITKKKICEGWGESTEHLALCAKVC